MLQFPNLSPDFKLSLSAFKYFPFLGSGPEGDEVL